jgi:NADPH-dependent curcumin reductase CurA
MDDIPSYIPPCEIGAPLDGRAIGEVIQSNSPEFIPGDLVKHMMGWRAEAVLSSAQATMIRPVAGVPLEAHLGILGATGATAYFGLFDVASVGDGDVVFVSAAAGAVGSMVVQLAKARGLTVIGSAGGAAECAWVRELGADEIIDYKANGTVLEKLRSAAPKGIDVYFGNVGGEHLDAALATGNQRSRFALCGMIESYNGEGSSAALPHLMQAVKCRMMLRGFISTDFLPRQQESEAYVGGLMVAGKVRPSIDRNASLAPSSAAAAAISKIFVSLACTTPICSECRKLHLELLSLENRSRYRRARSFMRSAYFQRKSLSSNFFVQRQ